MIADYKDILANEARQRRIVAEELAGDRAVHGDERRRGSCRPTISAARRI
jgi:DNA gyrase/topoisomerase IV subunit A